MNVLAEPLRPMPIKAERRRGRAGRAQARLDRDAGDGVQAARTHRGGAELREGARLAERRQSRLVWRRSHQSTSCKEKQRCWSSTTRRWPYRDLPAFMAGLRERRAMAALALEFCILTAARSGEVFGATWSEIDLGDGELDDSGRAHEDEQIAPGSAVGPRGGRDAAGGGGAGSATTCSPVNERGKPLSGHGAQEAAEPDEGRRDAARLPIELPRLGLGGDRLLARGGRGCPWRTQFRQAVERAYRRGDLFEKRPDMMREWADFLGSALSTVSTARGICDLKGY